ncbi:MAG: hypothetical protein H7336_09575 [Bacteriovorax sp.]|nr:hypothetical protein [Bacteriovorax sp.]
MNEVNSGGMSISPLARKLGIHPLLFINGRTPHSGLE